MHTINICTYSLIDHALSSTVLFKHSLKQAEQSKPKIISGASTKPPIRIESIPAEFALILGPGLRLHLFRSLHIKCSRGTIFWFLSDRNLNKLASVKKVLVCIIPRKIGVRTDFKDPWHLTRLL